MANKIKIVGGDINDGAYEDYSDSAEEYTEREKSLLKKYRQNRKRNDSSEEEVLGFDQSEDSDQADDLIADSDIEGKDEKFDDLPDSKAWGKKRSMYYNTDFVDPDYSEYTEKEQELAQQEEEEAKAIQQRLAAQLEDADFSLDIFSEVNTENDLEGGRDDEHIKLKPDLDDLTHREKIQLFEKESPEFKNLVNDFEYYFGESKTLLEPFLNYTLSKNIEHGAVKFAKSRNNLILCYCTNIGFYLMLKTKRIPIKNHPVIKRIVQLKKLLNQLDEMFKEIVKPEIEKVIQAIKSGSDFEINTEKSTNSTSKSKKKNKLNLLQSMSKNSIENKDEEISDEMSVDETMLEVEGADDENVQEAEEEEDNQTEDDRRAITYQIAKNKGLTPHRKKEQRNPRVKHRNKYRKAIIRRKGAVRTVRKEIKRYGGEISGIKATVKKGIKFRS